MPLEAWVQQRSNLLHGSEGVVLTKIGASTNAYLGVKDRGMVALGTKLYAIYLHWEAHRAPPKSEAASLWMNVARWPVFSTVSGQDFSGSL